MRAQAFGDGLAFSPEDASLAAAAANGAINIWNVEKKEIKSTLAGDDGTTHSLAWAPEGDRVAVGGERTVTIWEPFLARKLLTISVNEPLKRLEWRGSVLVGFTTTRVLFWDTRED